MPPLPSSPRPAKAICKSKWRGFGKRSELIPVSLKQFQGEGIYSRSETTSSPGPGDWSRTIDRLPRPSAELRCHYRQQQNGSSRCDQGHFDLLFASQPLRRPRNCRWTPPSTGATLDQAGACRVLYAAPPHRHHVGSGLYLQRLGYSDFRSRVQTIGLVRHSRLSHGALATHRI